MNITIRDERPEDIPTIFEIVREAFAGRPYADGDEQHLVNTMRDEGALSVSLVAEMGGELIGHISFSPAEAADGSGPWFALAPVSVRPDVQLKGIGSALIHEGIERIVAMDAIGCTLTGNPNYYCRFGFEVSPGNVPPGEPAEYFQMVCFTDHVPEGPIHFHSVFETLGQ